MMGRREVRCGAKRWSRRCTLWKGHKGPHLDDSMRHMDTPPWENHADPGNMLLDLSGSLVLEEGLE